MRPEAIVIVWLGLEFSCPIEAFVTSTRRLKAKRRPPPQPRLLDHGDAGAGQPLSLHFHSEAHRAPHLLMRVGPRDLPHALEAIAAGARPSAVVTGLNEASELTNDVRRSCARHQIDWFCDPQLWKTALPGYRTSPQLQALDYTPGRDADPYRDDEFDDRGFLAQIGRSVVGDQFDVGANGALAGGFVAHAPEDRWLGITAEMLRVGLAQRDALGPLPLVATVPLDMAGFCGLDAQRQLVQAISANRPDAYMLMLSGLHENSGADRIVEALRLALLLQEIGAPVILGRAGTLRHLFLAFGVRGVEFGLGRLLRFSIPDYEKSGGRGGPARFELPSLLGALAPELAISALSAEVLPETDCSCPACRDSPSPADKVARAPEHAAHTVCAEGERLDYAPPADRVDRLKRSLSEASWRWEELRVAKVVDGAPAYLRRWASAIDSAREAGLLNPRKLARSIGLA
jgi:hypothetical protein